MSDPLPKDQFSVADKVRESNRIEGILREPTLAECAEFTRFLNLERVTISELVAFVKVYQPDARMRDQPGLDVRVGNHLPPRGGWHIGEQLQGLLDEVNADRLDPWTVHLSTRRCIPSATVMAGLAACSGTGRWVLTRRRRSAFSTCSTIRLYKVLSDER